MDKTRFNTISEALYTYGASDFNTAILTSISIDELIFISTSTEVPRAAFRAAWALEHLLLHSPPLLHQYQGQIIDLYTSSNNWSVLRSITKLTIALTKANSKDTTLLSDEQEEGLLEKTFQVLAAVDCPIAVRCNAYDILFTLTIKHEWLAQELRTQILFDLEKNKTPALSSRGQKILKKIR
ncbi:MAG: hypothetical protein LBE37_18645 [Sphingobacterium sp.]|jgi:hypothetical protein|nr:hypothetical protein [Sphingobacterium sp.]